jgi:hypothetical protein
MMHRAGWSGPRVEHDGIRVVCLESRTRRPDDPSQDLVGQVMKTQLPPEAIAFIAAIRKQFGEPTSVVLRETSTLPAPTRSANEAMARTRIGHKPMRTHQAFPSRYLKAVSLNGKPLRVTIDRLENEEIGGEEKFVIYFQERDQGLALNKTNFESLEYLHGDSDDWPGKLVELYPDSTSYQGKRVACIRVRAAS